LGRGGSRMRRKNLGFFENFLSPFSIFFLARLFECKKPGRHFQGAFSLDVFSPLIFFFLFWHPNTPKFPGSAKKVPHYCDRPFFYVGSLSFFFLAVLMVLNEFLWVTIACFFSPQKTMGFFCVVEVGVAVLSYPPPTLCGDF